MPRGLGWLILRRLALGVPLVLIIVVLTFALVRLAPGDPALLLSGDSPTPEFLEASSPQVGSVFLRWTGKFPLPLRYSLHNYSDRSE